MPNIPHINNRITVDPLVKQGWRAYSVYDMQRENKDVGLGLFNPLKLGEWEGCFEFLS